MAEKTNYTSIHLVVTIVDGGKSEKVARVFHEEHVPIRFVSLGHGTARSEMLDLLGLGETKKDAVFCLVPGPRVVPALERLGDRMRMKYPGKGIAFSIPLSGVGARLYRALTDPIEKEASDMEQHKYEHEVVVALIDRGCTDLVMEAARKVGAPGGTVLSARSLADADVAQFLNISMQSEKELVFLVVPAEKKHEIMQAISREAGLTTPAHGMILSLPVSHAIGLA